MNNQQKEAAVVLANYFINEAVHMMDYSEHIDRGLDPRDHILYSAATVLDVLDSEGFTAELEVYNDKQWKKKQPK